MIRILCALSAIAMGTTVVLAQSSAIHARKDVMEGVGKDTKALSAMAKGEAPFDAAKASAMLGGWEAKLKKFVTLFPDDSKTGDKTRAKPEIWQNKADFEAKAMDLISAANTAKTATTAEAFKASFVASPANPRRSRGGALAFEIRT